MLENNNIEMKKDTAIKPPVRTMVVGIKFSNSGKVFSFRARKENFRVGDWVVVETEKGENIGIVAVSRHYFLDGKRDPATFKRILRKAAEKDMDRVKRNNDLEKEGGRICQQKIEERGLRMKLCRVEFSFDEPKATFYFSAEGRVDFRELVRDLAHHFKTKIEMKQIGVRDEARIIGGCGPCGIKLCCTTFLKDFEPVSIKMAKDQNLPLNSAKISGVCGRLMCCLVYEHATYKELKKTVPSCGSCVKTSKGLGKVDKVYMLQEKVLIAYPGEDRKEILSVSEVTVEKKGPDSKTRRKPKNKPPKRES